MKLDYDTSVAEHLRTHVHQEDIGLWCRLIPVAFEAARRNKLELRELLPDSIGDRDGRESGMSCLGWCRPCTGQIRIVLRFRHPKTDEWMGCRPEADIWRTLAHELAHLEEARHGARFAAIQANIEHDIDCIRRGQ